MADNPKRWVVPFATTGDRAPVPNNVQPGGTVSYAEGWGIDYERNPTSDPLAKRIPRDQTNQLAHDVTVSLKQLQEDGLSWFITPTANGGAAFPYGKGALVLYDLGAGDVRVFSSLVAANTALPTDATKWERLDPARFATQAEATAGALATVKVSPATMSRAAQSGKWNYAVAGGTANALTVTLDPAPAAMSALIGAPLRVRVAATNTGAATLNVNGLGAVPISRPTGTPVIQGDLTAGGVFEFVYNGLNAQMSGITQFATGGRVVFAAAGTSNWTVPAGVYRIFVRVWGGGGGGGGNWGGGGLSGSVGGAGGGYAEGWFAVTPGQVIVMTVPVAAIGGGTPGPGNNGGTVTVGSLCSATGGTGGQGASGTFPTPATTPGVGVGGQVNLRGIGGWTAMETGSGVIGGTGGSAANGGAVTFGAINGGGFPGQFPGGGGSGAAANNTIGGDGALGQIVIEW